MKNISNIKREQEDGFEKKFLVPFQIKMARSHHRRKHKHFQPPPHTETQKKKKGAATTFAIVGAVIVLIITYSLAPGSLGWIIGGTIIGAGIGYLIGRSLDRS